MVTAVTQESAGSVVSVGYLVLAGYQALVGTVVTLGLVVSVDLAEFLVSAVSVVYLGLAVIQVILV